MPSDQTPAVRFAEGSTSCIEGCLVPFTGPFPGDKDTYATRFTPATEYALDWFSRRPLLWTHSVKGGPGLVPVGAITDLAVRDDIGVWMQAELDEQSDYFDALKQMVDEDKLFLSSGSASHLVKIDQRSGDVLQWPIIEGSLTTTPANTHAVVIPSKSFRTACRTAGLEAVADEVGEHDIISPEAIRAPLDAAAKKQLDDSDYAYIDSKGGRHLPIPDAAHVRDALARFDQTNFESDAAKAAAKKKVLAAAKKFGVDAAENASKSARSFEDLRADIVELLNPLTPYGPAAAVHSTVCETYPDHVIACRYEDGDEPSYWRVDYSLNDDNHPVLGDAEEVEESTVPDAARASVAPLSLDALSLTRHADALAQRTTDLSERRAQEGRGLSASNLVAIEKSAAAMETAHRSLTTLLDQAVRASEEAAKVASMLDPDVRARHIAVLDLSAPI